MKLESSLQHSQQPATCPCLELDQSSPFPPSHFLQTLFNIIYPSASRSTKRSLSLSFPHQSPVCTSRPPLRATCPANLILRDLVTRIMFGEGYRSRSSSICNFLYSPITSSLLGPNILLNTLFSNTVSLHSSFNVRDHVPHPCKTIGKIIVRYILIVVGTAACYGLDGPGLESRCGQWKKCI